MNRNLNPALMTPQKDTVPWYKQFWPWFLISFPASAVIAGIATIIIAMHEPDGLVVGNYYKEGLAINEELARDRNAHFLGLQANGRIDLTSKQIRLNLTGKNPVAETTLQLKLLHPTRARQDKQLILKYHSENQSFTGSIPNLSPGNWHLRLSPEQQQWQLRGRVRIPGDGKFLLQSVLAQ